MPCPRRVQTLAARPQPRSVRSIVRRHRGYFLSSFRAVPSPTPAPPLFPPPPPPLSQTHDNFSLFCEDAFLVRIQMLQRDAGAARNAVVGVVRELRDNTRTAVDELGHLPEQRRTAGEDDAVVNDIGGELGRRILQHLAYRLRHLAELSPHRLHELVGRELHRAREPAHQIAPLDGEREFFIERYGGADLNLQLLGALVADGEIVLFFDVVNDCPVQPVARALHARRGDDAAERYHRDIYRSSSDVRDHASNRLLDRDARADGGEYRLLYYICILRARLHCRFNDCALLGRGHAGGNRDKHRRLKGVMTECLLHKIAEHRFGNAIVRDDAILHRTVRDDVVGGPADHRLRFRTDSEYLVAAVLAVRLAYRDDRRLIDDDPLPGHEDEDVGGPEVYAELGREETHIKPS